MAKRIKCPNCNGNCEHESCNGKGYYYNGSVDKFMDVNRVRCGPCNGTGKCPRCRGRGYIMIN